MRRLAGAVLLLGLLSIPGRAHAEGDEPVDLPPTGPLPNVRWYTLETPHFDLHYYPDERAFAERAAHIAERAYRLITRYLELAAGRPGEHHAQRSDGLRERVRELDPLQLHLRLRRAPELARRALRLRRLRQAAHHPRVHARRPPRHDPVLVPASHRHDLRKDLRAQPVAADLVHRGARGADGVAPHHRGPAALELLRHVPAGAVPRGARARPRHGVERSARVSPGEPPSTSTARASCATSRIATAPRSCARSRTATATSASRGASTA